MFNLFEAFESIKDEKEFENFLKDLCTPGEIKDLQDRFLVAQYLEKCELSQRAIAEKVKCSINTVTRVARFLNQESYKGYKTVLNHLNSIHHR
jgi:TrpR-related protein YerC/YecD